MRRPVKSRGKKKATAPRATRTTVRLYPADEDNATAIIRSGASSDLAGAVRLGLSIARRSMDGREKVTP